MLIDAGTDLEAADFVSKESALHVAVSVSADLAILLISRGDSMLSYYDYVYYTMTMYIL